MLPDDIRNLILNYAASMEEYDHRMSVHEELMCSYFFNRLYRIYTIFMDFDLNLIE